MALSKTAAYSPSESPDEASGREEAKLMHGRDQVTTTGETKRRPLEEPDEAHGGDKAAFVAYSSYDELHIESVSPAGHKRHRVGAG